MCSAQKALHEIHSKYKVIAVREDVGLRSKIGCSQPLVTDVFACFLKVSSDLTTRNSTLPAKGSNNNAS